MNSPEEIAKFATERYYKGKEVIVKERIEQLLKPKLKTSQKMGNLEDKLSDKAFEYANKLKDMPEYKNVNSQFIAMVYEAGAKECLQAVVDEVEDITPYKRNRGKVELIPRYKVQRILNKHLFNE